MRRRRPFRPPFRRPGARRVPPELQRANALMENGDFLEAANAFAQIAQQAERRRGPRAPIFHLRAGRAYAQADVIRKGMAHLKKGLSMIAARRDWVPLQRFGQRTVAELNELGFTNEAQEIAAYLKATLPTGAQTNAPTKTSASLPTHCPGCGAPVRSDEVEWIDDETAACIYCGNPIRGEQ